MPTTFHVQQEAFQGPLEVLLALIEKRKLLINDVSLSKVTDDFLQYVQTHPKLPVDETAHFVLIGSTLLLIKSRSLLPVLTLTEEEQESIDDLEVRLKLLDIFKRTAPGILELYGKNVLFERQPSKKRPVEFSPDNAYTLDALRGAMYSVLHNLPKQEQRLAQVTVQKVVSLEEMVDRLTKRVNESLRTSFKDFAGSYGEGSKVDIVVSFLAMLELVKQGIIRVEQEARFGDIVMESDSVGVPNYS